MSHCQSETFPSQKYQTWEKLSFVINLVIEHIVKESLEQMTTKVFKSEHFMHVGRMPPC